MSDETSESLAAARRVDACCDEFELALATGKSPQIESFLTDLSAAERQTLLLELLGLELDYRVAHGEQPKVGDYAKRFPELSAEQLAALVEASRGRAGVIPSVGSAVPNAEQPTILSPTDEVELANDASAAALRRVRYFGDYELLREIARGGMGVVYEARQRSLNRPVALKMILSGQLASAEEVARFRREAEAAAQLEHPGIVPIFEIGTDGDQHYFTMGYVSGPSLSARLLERPLEPREAATLIRDVALAVQYAHERGVVHRDLKPSNILLQGLGVMGQRSVNDGESNASSPTPDLRPLTPRITDFGLAKVSHADHSLTETGQILGTPSYMPPEQASGLTHLIGPAADIYSLGAVLYACLTGRPPFQAASVLDTVRQVLERDPVSLRDLNATIPQDLETICLKCLEKSIPRRYSSAQAVADELQRYLEGRPIEARPVSRRERSWRWCRRNPVVAGLMAAVAMSLLLGIAVSSYFAWQENQRAIAESDARRDEGIQRQKAERQTEIAKKLGADNLKLAEDEKAARQKADLNAEAARQQTKLAKRNLYAAHMNLIQAAWDANRVGEAVRILELYRPAEGQADDPDDLRSFEWYYWDRCCHRDLLALKNQAPVQSVTFSPDGKFVASGGIGVLPIKVWDLNTGLAVMSLRGHRANNPLPKAQNEADAQRFEALRDTETTTVHCVAYRLDGQRLASGGDDGMIKIWDVTTGQVALTLKGHAYRVQSVSFSPDGSRLASTAVDGIQGSLPWEFKLWDAVTGQELRSLTGVNGSITSVTFSPNGKRLATTTSDGTGAVKLWDADSGEALLTMSGRGSLRVAFSPDGERLASAGQEIKVWHTDTGQELLTLKGHADSATSVAFSPDGQRLVSASGDQTIKVWRADNGQELLTLKGHTEWINSVTFSPDGTLIASASRDGTIKLWDSAANQEWQTLKGVTAVSLAMSGDGRKLAFMSGGRSVHICDAATGRAVRTLEVLARDGRSDSTGLTQHVALSHDGQQLAVACQDATVRLFDVKLGQEIHLLKAHTYNVEALAFSPNGKRLLTGESDSIVREWDTLTGQETRTLKGHTRTVFGLAFSPDGKWFASSSADNTVIVWDATSGRRTQTLKGHTEIVRSVAFRPDGKRLASASFDRTVKVWDTLSGQEQLTLKGHTDVVTNVVFSPDGKRVVSSESRGPVKVWDSVTGQELVSFKGNALGAFSSDGMRLFLKGGIQSKIVSNDSVIVRDAAASTDAKLNPNLPTSQPNVEAAISEGKPSNVDKFRQDVAFVWKGWTKDAPPPALVPFNAEQAKQSQEAWAKHLGVPVEYTNSTGMKFRLIPPGEFVMGSTRADIEAVLSSLGQDHRSEASIRSEGPQHKVILTQPIYLGVHEVTQAEYERVMARNPSHFAPTGTGKEAVAGMDTTNHPVDSVSWVDAAEFCAKLSQQENLKPYYFRVGERTMPLGGTGYRLPTEAEWEFSCRAGTTTKFWIGDTDEDLAQTGWFGTNTGSRTNSVGSLKANSFGLHDMHGNLWEWAQDGWDSNGYRQYQDKPAINPSASPFSTPQRVLRGGSWAGPAVYCRATYRHSDVATLRHRNCGFRVALSVDALKPGDAKTRSGTGETNVLVQSAALARQKKIEGDKHRDQKEYAQAIACYREVIAHEPNNLAILNRLAWIMAITAVEGQSASDAVDFAQRASQRDPNDLNYRNTLGAAQCRAGQFAEALRNLGEVDENAPPDFRWRTHNQLFQAMCHQKLGDRPKAQAAYDKAMELLKPADGDTSLWFEEARLLQKEVEALLNPSGTDQKRQARHRTASPFRVIGHEWGTEIEKVGEA